MIYVITRAEDNLPVGVAGDEDSARAIVAEHAEDGLACHIESRTIIRPYGYHPRHVWIITYPNNGRVDYHVGLSLDRLVYEIPGSDDPYSWRVRPFSVERMLVE